MPFLRFPEHPPPAPMLATYNELTGAFQVVFDRPLLAGELDASNWIFDSGPTVAATATAIADRVEGTIADVGEEEFSTLTYDPPPFDVRSSEGVAAAGFTIGLNE